MKRNYLLITSLIGLVTLTGCHYAPTTAKYNGVTYQNGWYQYTSNGALLYPCGLLPSSEEPLFNKRKYNFWFTDKFSFDILYAEYEDSQFWKPNVYIAKDKVEEAKAFYQDKTNYNYYLSIRFKDESEVLIENEEEKAIIDVAIDAIMNNKKPKDTIKKEEKPSIQNLACCRKSKDGLFMTIRYELVVYDETVYFLKEINASSNIWTSYDLGDAGKTLYSMFVNYHLLG